MVINPKIKVVLLIIVSAACFSASIISTCIPFIANYFNVSSSNASSLIAFFLFGYLFGQIIFYIVAQYYGYKKSLLIGFLIYIISCVFQIIEIKNHNLNLLLLFRFIGAMGLSSGLICAFAMINEFSEGQHQTQNLISYAFISLTLSAYLSVTLGAFLTNTLGWIFVFYFNLILSFLYLIAIYYLLPDIDQIKTKEYRTYQLVYNKFIAGLSNKKLIFYSLIVSSTTTTTYLFNALGSSIARNLYSTDLKTFGILAIFNLLALILGSVISTSLLKKFSTLKTLNIGILVWLLPVINFLIFSEMIFEIGSNGFWFYSNIILLNTAVGIIYPPSSFLALGSIACSKTASSIMNFIKIGMPALTIFIIGHSNLPLIPSFKLPLEFIASFLILCIFMQRYKMQSS